MFLSAVVGCAADPWYADDRVLSEVMYVKVEVRSVTEGSCVAGVCEEYHSIDLVILLDGAGAMAAWTHAEQWFVDLCLVWLGCCPC